MKLYEVTVRLEIEEAFVVAADNEDDAKYRGSVVASHSYNDVHDTHVVQVVPLEQTEAHPDEEERLYWSNDTAAWIA